MSKLKRVSETTETAVTRVADREGRTFVAQLDRLVEAGFEHLGLTPNGDPKPTTTRAPRKRTTAAAK